MIPGLIGGNVGVLCRDSDVLIAGFAGVTVLWATGAGCFFFVFWEELYIG
jgi:hypothetical protein